MSKIPVVSLIVAIRNEESVIDSLLDSLNPGMNDEIIFVLDRCTDETESKIKNHAKASFIKILSISETHWPAAPKKFAILQGINAATGEWLLFTDADCLLPADFFTSWRDHFALGDIGIGFSMPLPSGKNFPFSHLLQFIDAGVTASLYRFFTRMGWPYMSVGRNWGYKRSLFQEIFLKDQKTIKSGDDDLLLQKLLATHKTNVFLNEAINVNTRLQPTFLALIRQKLRHYQTGLKYPVKMQLILPFFQAWWVPILLLTIPAAIIVSGNFWWVGSGLILAGTFIWIRQISFLYKKIPKTVIPVIQLLIGIPLYFFIFPLISVFSHLVPVKWK